jgi:hypothetical protein
MSVTLLYNATTYDGHAVDAYAMLQFHALRLC